MPQRCLYEVLGIERTADDDIIKKAYRKQALIWHPGEKPLLQALLLAAAAVDAVQNAVNTPLLSRMLVCCVSAVPSTCIDVQCWHSSVPAWQRACC
jgi:preprotein translocase subunit Sec63